MLSIEEIKSYLPKNKLDILKTYKHINKKFLTNKIGTTKVTRKNKNEDIVSMCVAAYKKLKKIKKKKLNFCYFVLKILREMDFHTIQL